MPDLPIAREEALRELERILASRAFQGTGRSGALLRFLVERTLAGHGEHLKEYIVGAEALGRGESFDPRTDAIVRVEISRLRSRLSHFYATEGAANPVRIAVPKGSYAPVFESAPVIESTSGIAKRPRDLGRRAALATVALAVVSIAALALWFLWSAQASPPAPVTRLELDLGDSVVMRSTQVGSSSVIISPDGRRLVFVSFRNQEPRLMTRDLSEIGGSESVELPGTAGVRGPFFSPDGHHVGFLAGKRLWKTRVDGGEPTVICDATELLGASWGDDGSIVAALTATGLARVSSNGGTPEPIAGTPAGARWPQVLPGSKAVLFTAGQPGPGPLRIEVLSLIDGTVRTLMQGVSYARYLSSGHLAWVARQTLFVAPFDRQRLELTGPAVPVVEDIAPSMYAGADFDVSYAGTLVFRRQTGGRASTIQTLDRSRPGTPLLSTPAEYFLPSVSPDGTRLAFSLGETPRVEDFQILDLRSGAIVKPVTAGIRAYATWVPPDGRFLVGVGSSGEIRWMRTDGSEAAGTLLAIPDAVLLPWSIDGRGRRLAFYQRGTSDESPVTFDLWTVPVTVEGEALHAGTPEPFVVSDAFEIYPAFSPDGRWIAHVSLEEDAYQIYVRQYPDSGRKWRVSDQGGTVAAWSPDGRRLFYESLDHRVMAVDFRVVNGEFRPDPPTLWADAQLADTGMGPGFEVAPDGRLVALMAPSGSRPRQDASNVTLVLNFFSEVKRRTSQ
jgi:serine/threonine-protein kinase